MKILVVTSEAPPIVSGISRCVGELADGLQRRGHEVDVISSTQIPRVKLDEYRFSAMVAYWPRIARRFAEYDLINLHGPVPTLSDVFLLLSRLFKRGSCPPIVYTHHCAIEIEGHEQACRVYNTIHLKLASLATAVVASSTWYAQPLRRLDRRVEVIPWGVDPSAAPAAVKEDGPLKVLFVGQMRPYKGVEVLLEATANLPGVELALVGSGAHLREYQEAARQRRASNVKFLGRLPDDMLRAEYASSDVIVLPSTTHAEAFGLVVLEGMASECVPVVSSLPGVRDLPTSESGHVVPCGDPFELRRTLQGLAGDRGRLRRMQTAARRRAEQLSWDRCVDEYETLFEAVLAPQSQPAPAPVFAPARPVPSGRVPGRAAMAEQSVAVAPETAVDTR